MTGRNIKNGFFEHLGKTIKDAFFVFSVQGDLLFFNDEAESLLNITPSSTKVFEIFSESALEKFKEFTFRVMENLNFISAPAALELSCGEIVNAEVILSCYNLDDQQVILCTLSKKSPDFKPKEVSKVKTQLNKIEELIRNKKIIDIISKIKTSYPFTFLGKEKLRAEIDTFDEIFWVRSSDGVYLLVNRNLAKALGSNAVKIEGKEENSFLAPYLAEFNWTLDSYLKQTGNCLIIEGLPFKGLSIQGSLQTIEIPLRDADSNVTAVIGITQKKFTGSEQTDECLSEAGAAIIKNLPLPFAYFNREEILIHSTEEFCKLFRIGSPETGKFTFRQLPVSLAAKFDDFIGSPLDKTKFEFCLPDLGYEFREGFFSCHLKKVFGSSSQFEGISLLIEESSSELNQRGIMVNDFIQKNPEPIFVYDKDNLKFLDVNKSALSLYGFNKEQFLQMDLTDLYSAEDIQSLLESSEYASKEGEFTGPFKHKKKDGSQIVVELSKIGIKYNDKDAFLNIIRDFSDKFEQEKKNQLYKSAFDKTDDLLFITDASGFIKLTNNAVGTKLGYSDDELNDASFATLTIDEERGNINSSIFQSKSKEPQTISTTIKKSSGEAVKAELNAIPVLDYKNEIDSFNIIAKLQSEEPKSAAKTESSDDYTGTISPVFLSSLFHEILTPINAILGFVQELTESIQTKTPEQKEAAKIINQNRASLLHTLNTIAEYTSLERNEYDISFEDVRITEMVDKLQKEIEEFSGLRGTEFAYGKISSSLEFKTDKYKFMSLLSLLIRIVIRLTREKKIFLSAYQLDEEFFMVTIRDQHSSVSKYLLDCLNAIFQKEKVEKEFGVSRISINLSKKLLNLLNGRFEVLVKDNKLDYGFLFPFGTQVEPKKIEKEKPARTKEKASGKKAKEEEKPEPEVKTIPLDEGIKWEGESETSEELVLEEFEPQPAAAPPAKPGKQIDLSKITCLYIEDQIDSQILFKVQMKDLRDIKFAVSFEEAIPLFKSYNFDLIVIDMNLSGEYNGLDALKMIHQISGFETTPVIAVSAYVLPGDKEKFISAGFSDFISKPLFREKMIDSINKIFPAE